MIFLFNIPEKAVEKGLKELKAVLSPFRKTPPVNGDGLNDGVAHHLPTIHGVNGGGLGYSCSSFGLSCRLEASNERG